MSSAVNMYTYILLVREIYILFPLSASLNYINQGICIIDNFKNLHSILYYNFSTASKYNWITIYDVFAVTLVMWVLLFFIKFLTYVFNKILFTFTWLYISISYDKDQIWQNVIFIHKKKKPVTYDVIFWYDLLNYSKSSISAPVSWQKLLMFTSSFIISIKSIPYITITRHFEIKQYTTPVNTYRWRHRFFQSMILFAGKEKRF